MKDSERDKNHAVFSYEHNIRIGINTEVGENTAFHSNAVIGDNVRIGKNCFIGDFVLIMDNVTIGDGSKVGAHCSIEPHATLGKNNNLQGFCMISEYSSIGDDNFIGPYFNNPADNTIGSPPDPYVPDPAVIKNRVRIGSRVVVTPGNTLNDDCIIGAGAVITKDVPSGETWVGNPGSLLEVEPK